MENMWNVKYCVVEEDGNVFGNLGEGCYGTKLVRQTLDYKPFSRY